MAIKLYRKTTLVLLKAVDGNDLNDGDLCYLCDSASTFSIYQLDADSGEAESSPEILEPTTNPGSKRWKLLNTVNTVSYFGGLSTEDGTWKIEVSGTDLIVYRRESSVYVEKGRFTA